MNGKNKLTITVLLAVLATVLLASGCGPTPTPTLPGESLEWEETFSEPVSPYKETNPMMRVIVTPEQASELEDFLQLPSHLKPVSDADFGAYLVIAIFQGEKATTGYSVEVVDVRLEGNVITIYAEFLTPPTPAPGQIVGVGPAVTSPYCVLRVKKTLELGGDFIFVLIANGEEIMRQDQFIS